MSKKSPHLTVQFQFDKDLVKKSKAYGLYFPIANNSNNVVIKINSTDSQQDLINTLYHEFTHFITDLVLDPDHFRKYFYDFTDNRASLDSPQKFSQAEIADRIQRTEPLCVTLSEYCAKLVMEYAKTNATQKCNTII